MSIANTNVNNHDNLTNLSTVAQSDNEGGSLPLYPSIGSIGDLSIGEFLRRPVLLYTLSGTGDITTNPVYQYAKDYFALTAIQQKMKFVRLLRGTLRLQFVVTTTPYAAGQFIAAVWMGGFAEINAPLIGDSVTYPYYLSSRTHVIMDASTCNPACLTVPIHIRYPFFNVAASSDANLDEMWMGFDNMTPIVSTLDGTNAPFKIKIYVSMESSELAVPVVQDTGSIYTSEVQKTADGPISYPASIVANVGKKLKDVPGIGKFAYATSLAAGAVSSIATLFGFSRPKDLSEMNYPHDEDFAGYAGNLRVKTLTLDPLQEVPIDSSFLGEPGDNLTYANIIQRYGLLTTVTWNKTQVQGTNLKRIHVSPCVQYVSTSGVYAVSPLAYASQMFNLWRGTIRYKIVIPANRFVRGKVRIFFSPTEITSLTTKFNDITQNLPSVLLDLSTTSEVIFEIPWSRLEPYLAVTLISSSLANVKANGFMYIMVEEPLEAPATSLTLTLLVWIAAGDQFEFMIPDLNKLQFLRRELWNTAYDDTNLGAFEFPLSDQYMPITTSAPGLVLTDELYQTYTMESNANVPILKDVDSALPSDSTDNHIRLHMGEKFLSFRPFLKRFYPYFRLAGISSDVGIRPQAFFIPYLPQEPLFSVSTGVKYPQMMMTPLRYISNLFYGVRGSVRYRLSPDNFVSTTTKYQASRFFNTPHAMTSCPLVEYPNWIWAKANTGSGEAAFVVGGNEPAYLEVPWQCVSQFKNTERNSNVYTNVEYGVNVWSSDPISGHVEIYCAAGEDFNPVIWNGVPMLGVFPPGIALV